MVFPVVKGHPMSYERFVHSVLSASLVFANRTAVIEQHRSPEVAHIMAPPFFPVAPVTSLVCPVMGSSLRSCRLGFPARVWRGGRVTGGSRRPGGRSPAGARGPGS